MQLKLPSRRRLVTAGLISGGFLAGVLAATLPDLLPSTSDAPAPGARLTLSASAYCKGTTTASGMNVRRGVAAADPALLPAGTVISLSTGVPEFDGVYSVLDTGPLIKGPLVDLYVWSCHEALDFGRRDVQATVLRLGWDPRASAATLAERIIRRRPGRAVVRPAAERSGPAEGPQPASEPGPPPIEEAAPAPQETPVGVAPPAPPHPSDAMPQAPDTP